MFATFLWTTSWYVMEFIPNNLPNTPTRIINNTWLPLFVLVLATVPFTTNNFRYVDTEFLNSSETRDGSWVTLRWTLGWYWVIVESKHLCPADCNWLNLLSCNIFQLIAPEFNSDKVWYLIWFNDYEINHQTP